MSDSQFNQEQFVSNTASLALRLKNSIVSSSARSFAETLPGNLDQTSIEQELKRSEDEMKKKKVRETICAALGSAGDDFTDIAKTIAAALLPLAFSGVVSIPVTPLAFACAILVVYRAGISAYCAGYSGKKNDNS